MKTNKDHTGLIYGFITVLGEAERHPNYPGRQMRCECKCGKVWDVCLQSLVSGGTKSCGCHSRESAKKRSQPENDHPVEFSQPLTGHLVQEFLDYHPSKGTLIWKVRDRRFFTSQHAWRVWNGQFAGRVAGGLDCKGYIMVGIFNKSYRAHRLIFLMVSGEFPPDQVDHINGNKSDNRWRNLRLATRSQNQRNQKLCATNTSGVKGVYFENRSQMWCVQIRREDGKRFSKGRFHTKKEAEVAAREARTQLHGEFANHG